MVAQLEADLVGKDREARATALLSLGYIEDGAHAAELLRGHLAEEPDEGLRAHAVIALLRNHPREALPLLGGLLEDGTDRQMSREDFEVIARQTDVPERVHILIAFMSSECDESVYAATRSMRLLGPEAEPAVPELIRALEDEPAGPLWANIWMAAAQALGRIGEAARPAMPILLKRLESDNRFVLADVASAIGRIDGPHAQQAVPRVRSLLSHESERVRKAAAEALKALAASEWH